MSAFTCPTCCTKGRPIGTVTVESLAQGSVLKGLHKRDGFSYCPAAECPVAWFHPETGQIVEKSELKVLIGMKETTGQRPICYCFGHDAAEFEADIQHKGHSNLPAEIAAKCKQGLDRCAEKNPQGSCCLGNVNRIIQTARKEADPTMNGSNPFAIAPEPD